MLISIPKTGSLVGSIPNGCKVENSLIPWSLRLNKLIYILQSCHRFLEDQTIGMHLHQCSSPSTKTIQFLPMKGNSFLANSRSILTILSYSVRKIPESQARPSWTHWSLLTQERYIYGIDIICEAASFYLTFGFFSVAIISAGALGWWE